MPMYPYCDTNTGKTFDVLRDVDDRDRVPTEEEALKEDFTKEEYEAAVWVRKIPSGLRVSYKQGSLKGHMGSH